MKFYAVHIEDKHNPDDPSPYVWLNRTDGREQVQITSDKAQAEDTVKTLTSLHPDCKYSLVEFDGPGSSVTVVNGRTKLRSR